MRRAALAVLALAGCISEPPPPAQLSDVAPPAMTAPAAQTAALPVPQVKPPHDTAAETQACLTRTVYFEARGRPRREMAAVAHVVLNRVRHRDWPDTVCAVVHEGGPTPPCQFSWYCDGRSDVPRNRREFAAADTVAREVLAGKLADPSNGANMFHNATVRPRWTRVAESRGKIGAQYFWYLRRR